MYNHHQPNIVAARISSFYSVFMPKRWRIIVEIAVFQLVSRHQFREPARREVWREMLPSGARLCEVLMAICIDINLYSRSKNIVSSEEAWK